MPVKNPDPFFDFIEKLDPKVNPYVEKIVNHVVHQTLPLSYGQDLRRFAGHWVHGIRNYYTRKNSGNPAISEPALVSSLAPHPGEPPHHPLVLEIGCHNGHTLTSLALDHPTWTFVGLDITFKRIVTTAERLAKAKVQNAFCALANAQNLSQIFSKQELDGIVIFFPDPWVKKARQTKNRLINDRFMLEIKQCLKRTGFVWFKSDQKIYFDQVASLMSAHGFGAIGPLPPELGQDYSSRFESGFHAQGIPTYGCVFQMLDA